MKKIFSKIIVEISVWEIQEPDKIDFLEEMKNNNYKCEILGKYLKNDIEIIVIKCSKEINKIL